MKKFILLLFLLCSKSLMGAITFDAVSGQTAENSATASWTHTTGAVCSTQLILVVYVAWVRDAGINPVSTVTYNTTESLSLVSGYTHTGAARRIEMWSRVSPSSGAKTVDVTLSGAAANSIRTQARTYCGVDQTTSFGTVATNEGSASPVTVNVSAASNDLVIDGAFYGVSSTETATVGAGQTDRHNIKSTRLLNLGSEEAGATTVTMSWTVSLNHYWATIGVALKPAAASSSTVPILLSHKRRRSQ